MSAIISEKLKSYNVQSVEEEQDALKEILQNLILYALSEASFFKDAAFHGGTSLRIVHGMTRYSEDLDFILKAPNPTFQWEKYLSSIQQTCQQYGIIPEVVDKGRAGKAIQKMILKDTSIVKLLNLSFHHHAHQKLSIKLEIDTNPPKGAKTEMRFLDFPLLHSIEILDLPSNFAGKIHALLCRKFIKGRDWYDFLWYVARDTEINYEFLTNAINQTGPWAGKEIMVDKAWFLDKMEEKIATINWKQAVADVSPFIIKTEQKTLNFWSRALFTDRLKKCKSYL